MPGRSFACHPLAQNLSPALSTRREHMRCETVAVEPHDRLFRAAWRKRLSLSEMRVAESGQAYFLDNSALVKLYHQELGSEVVETWAATPGVRLWVSDLTRVELYSVFSRKMREGELAEAALQRVLECFREDLCHRVQIVRLTSGLIERAIGFLIEHDQTHPLRTLDALQMTSALVVEPSVLIFVTADKRLLTTVSQVFPRALNPEVQS